MKKKHNNNILKTQQKKTTEIETVTDSDNAEVATVCWIRNQSRAVIQHNGLAPRLRLGTLFMVHACGGSLSCRHFREGATRHINSFRRRLRHLRRRKSPSDKLPHVQSKSMALLDNHQKWPSDYPNDIYAKRPTGNAITFKQTDVQFESQNKQFSNEFSSTRSDFICDKKF